MMTTTPNRESGCTNLPIDAGGKEANRTAQMILDWARDRRLLRLRSDRRMDPRRKNTLPGGQKYLKAGESLKRIRFSL